MILPRAGPTGWPCTRVKQKSEESNNHMGELSLLNTTSLKNLDCQL